MGVRFIFLLLSICFLSGNGISAQGSKHEPTAKAKDIYTKAHKFYFKKDYEKALEFCADAKKADPAYEDPYKLRGTIFSEENKYEEEKAEYKEFLQYDSISEMSLLNLGTITYKHGDYKESIEYYTKYLATHTTSPERKKLILARIDNMKSAMVLVNHPQDFHPVNLGPNINTKLNEFPPTFTIDGETMYFTRRKLISPRDNGGDALKFNPRSYNDDIMVSHLVKGIWDTARDAEGLNTSSNEGAMCISPDGTFMIFTLCSNVATTDLHESPHDNCDLYISYNQNGKWSPPKNMGEPVNSRFYETQPSISFDGRTIYFVAQLPGGYGGLDIYKSTKNDNGDYSIPLNLGPNVNSAGNESTPFIHPDDQTLYFSSDGHGGMGHLDIFYSRKNAIGGFDSAINFGYPINTADNDEGIVVDRLGEYAYYSSGGNNSRGGMDIFYFKMPEKAKPHPVTYLKGKVMDNISKATIPAVFELVDIENKKIIIKNTIQANGEFLIPVPMGKNYLVNVSAKGYLFYSDNIPLKEYKGTEPFIKNILLLPLKTGEKITLKNIFFKTDSYALLDESSVELDRLVSLLKANPGIKIEISGHTDNTGNAEHNKELSLKRAQSVFNYLVTQGKIPSSRLKSAGYGDSQPVATNDTEEGRAQNRRTEIKVID